MTPSRDAGKESLAHRIRGLAEMARELRKGQHFPVTRLTVLKTLCQDERDGAEFLVHLASAARDQLARRHRPRRVSPQEWARQQRLVYEPRSWGGVRIITNPSLLVVEDALRGVLAPTEVRSWAYRAARDFAERYDSRFPAGLVPKSAPLVGEIADFWCRRFDGRSSGEWLASVRDERRQSVPRRSTQARKAPPSDVMTARYPTLARWVRERGWIELGHSEGSRAFVRALDEGGLVWEGESTYPTLDAALASLEKGLTQWLASN